MLDGEAAKELITDRRKAHQKRLTSKLKKLNYCQNISFQSSINFRWLKLRQTVDNAEGLWMTKFMIQQQFYWQLNVLLQFLLVELQGRKDFARLVTPHVSKLIF